jgi:hypothetical protein
MPDKSILSPSSAAMLSIPVSKVALQRYALTRTMLIVGPSYGSFPPRRDRRRCRMLGKSRYRLTSLSLLTGDFDFGVDQMMYLVEQCRFPWLIGNVFHDGKPLGNGRQTYLLTASNGIKIGLMGLVEKYDALMIVLIVENGSILLTRCLRISTLLFLRKWQSN